MKNTKLFMILIICAVVLATGQINSVTPFKFVLFRNFLIAWAVYWWQTRKIPSNKSDIFED